MSGILVSGCDECGWHGFPTRFWCPSCGATTLTTVEVTRGVVEDVTFVVRAPGRKLEAPVGIATVALADGGRAIARLSRPTDIGEQIAVRDNSGVPDAS